MKIRLMALAMCFVPTASHAQNFFVINNPDLPDQQLGANGISADGRTVVGDIFRQSSPSSVAADQAFMWTLEGGFVDIGASNTVGADRFLANAVSGDGTYITGGMRINDEYHAYRYDQVSGFTPMTDPSQELPRTLGLGISDDGSTAVGYVFLEGLPLTQRRAYRWTQDTGMEPIGLISEGGAQNFSDAQAVSADGSVIVGGSTTADDRYLPFRWTESGGMVSLGDVSSGIANDINADGTVIVGQATLANGREAFRWTEEDGIVGLGDLVGGSFTSEAYAVNGDGSVVVGRSRTGVFDDVDWEAFIWTEQDGMQNLAKVLTDSMGVDLEGWQIIEALDVSDDGNTIVGRAYDPNGLNRAFVAVIPAPSTSLTVVVLMIAHRRRR